MTFATLKTQMIALADDPAITNDQAGIWINANYALLLREYEWPFTVGSGTYTVTSGTAEKAFSAFSTAVNNFAKPLRVWIASSSGADKTLLKPISYENRNIPGLDGYYYITPDNLSIGLVKTPTNSTNIVTVDYLKKTTSMDDSVYTTPVFLDDFHWILIWKPLINYQYQQREQSDEFARQYEEILASMLKFYKLPQAASNPGLSRGVYMSRSTGTTDPLNMR